MWGRLRKIKNNDFPLHIALIFIGMLTFYPFIMMIILSFKDMTQYTHHPWSLTLPIHWENYAAAWEGISRYILNSVLVSGSTVLGVVFLGAFTAYVFSRFQFPGKSFLFFLILSLLMIPGVLTLVPQFMLVRQLGLLNTLWVLILPYISLGQVMAIFILRSFMSGISEELFEAARIDGAGNFQCFWQIVLPLSKPILGVIAIIQTLRTWNDLIWPWVTISKDNLRTITIGLAFFRGQYYTNWGLLFAGYVLASIPLIILFAFASKWFVSGLTSGALKM